MNEPEFINNQTVDLFLMKAVRYARLLEGEDLFYLKECIMIVLSNTSKERLGEIFKGKLKEIKHDLNKCYRFTDRIHAYNMIKKNNGKLNEKQLDDYVKVLTEGTRAMEYMSCVFSILLKHTEFGKLHLPKNMIYAPLDRPSAQKKQQDERVKEQLEAESRGM